MSSTQKHDNYNLSPNEQREFNRRLAIVRARLHSLMLKRNEKETSPEAIINCLYVLVQEPMLVFLYKAISGSLRLVRYYDHKRALQGRSGIKLLNANRTEINVEEAIPIDEKHRVFSVFGTLYYLRIFRYIDEDTTADFVETNPWNNDEEKVRHSAHPTKDADRDLRRYISLSVEALFGEKGVKGVAEQPHVGALGTFVEDAFFEREKNEIVPADNNSNRLVPAAQKKKIEQLAEEIKEELLRRDKGLDRVQRQSMRVASRIKLMANEKGPTDSDYPNMFWLFRTFDRVGEQRALGYDYNLQFVLTDGQCEDVANYLRAYCVTDIENDERYGEWLSQEDDKLLAELAEQLDKKFWACFNECQSNAERVKFLRSIFDHPYGVGAVSFADTVFHGGLIQVRTPFRRYAGLDRVKVVFDARNATPQRKLLVEQLSEEELRDCLRVVAIYYLLGGCGQNRQKRRNSYRTRVVLFPISVYQVTVGVIGCVVFESHGTGKDASSVPVPQRLSEVPSGHWDMVYHFFRDVYTPVQRDVRRLYRDIQVILLRKRMAASTWEVLVDALTTDIIEGQRMRGMSEDLTSFGLDLARFIPYPAIRFSFETSVQRDSSRSVRFDDLFHLDLSNDAENPYFRLRREPTSQSSSREISYGVMNLHVAQMRLQEVFQTQIAQFVATKEAWDQRVGSGAKAKKTVDLETLVKSSKKLT